MIFRGILILLVVGIWQSSHAESQSQGGSVDKSDPQQVFAYQGDAVLTQAEVDAAFSKIDEDYRLSFIRDGARVDKLVKSLMKVKVVALDAKASEYHLDPLIRDRMIQAANQELADAWIEKIADNAPEADYEAMAYEDYLANPEKYRTEKRIDVSHILIATENRSDADAKALAETVREQVLDAPDEFERLVEEYSDDPGKVRNKGLYTQVRRGQMVKPFENAAFALENPGDISDLVKTEYGYHIIRLEKRRDGRQRSFDEVREEAVASAEQRHRAEYQQRYMSEILSEPIVLPEGSVEVMLKRYFGENLENAPRFDLNGIKTSPEG